jgi:deoxyribose-phosphate aldolase
MPRKQKKSAELVVEEQSISKSAKKDNMRNQGTDLELDWINSIRVNKSAIERRTSTLVKRRTVKKDWQIAWMLKAVTCIDLTTLAGDDTPGRVHRLCAKAKQPIRKDILSKFGFQDEFHVGAVCVYHQLIDPAVKALKGTGIPVAAVSTGFPAGQIPMDVKIREIEESLAAGAREIDIVISRPHVLTHNWQALYNEVKTFRDVCGEAHLKAIIATGELGTLTNVQRASMVCMMAGADFIKTSTGKEPVNATLPVSLTMVRAIRDYYQQTGNLVGFKPAGGIRTAKESVQWLLLMKEELDNRWLEPELFRLGASSLLADIERQLEFHLSGIYSAYHRHPMA